MLGNIKNGLWNTYYKVKIAILKLRYPKAGRNERALLAVGYTEKQLNELKEDYKHVANGKEEIFRDELFYINN